MGNNRINISLFTMEKKGDSLEKKGTETSDKMFIKKINVKEKKLRFRVSQRVWKQEKIITHPRSIETRHEHSIIMCLNLHP